MYRYFFITLYNVPRDKAVRCIPIYLYNIRFSYMQHYLLHKHSPYLPTESPMDQNACLVYMIEQRNAVSRFVARLLSRHSNCIAVNSATLPSL
jgi:hypothetical protein